MSARERLTKWFVEVRQGGSGLGQNVMELAMKNLVEQQRVIVSLRLKSTSSKRLRARMKGQQLHRLRSKSSSEVLKMDLNSGRPDTQLDSLLTRFVDYTPVYQFLHIFDCLDVKQQAIEIYKANRLPQIKLESMGTGKYLQSLVIIIQTYICIHFLYMRMCSLSVHSFENMNGR